MFQFSNFPFGSLQTPSIFFPETSYISVHFHTFHSDSSEHIYNSCLSVTEKRTPSTLLSANQMISPGTLSICADADTQVSEGRGCSLVDPREKKILVLPQSVHYQTFLSPQIVTLARFQSYLQWRDRGDYAYFILPVIHPFTLGINIFKVNAGGQFLSIYSGSSLKFIVITDTFGVKGTITFKLLFNFYLFCLFYVTFFPLYLPSLNSFFLIINFSLLLALQFNILLLRVQCLSQRLGEYY